MTDQDEIPLRDPTTPDGPSLNRITCDPAVMGGRACVRGMRVTVGMIVGQIATGASFDDLLHDYPYLEKDDITQALRYAAWLTQEWELSVHTS